MSGTVRTSLGTTMLNPAPWYVRNHRPGSCSESRGTHAPASRAPTKVSFDAGLARRLHAVSDSAATARRAIARNLIVPISELCGCPEPAGVARRLAQSIVE